MITTLFHILFLPIGFPWLYVEVHHLVALSASLEEEVNNLFLSENIFFPLSLLNYSLAGYGILESIPGN